MATLAQHWSHFYFKLELSDSGPIAWFDRALKEGKLKFEDESFLRVYDANTEKCVQLRRDALEFGQLMQQVITEEPRHANCDGLNSPDFFSDTAISKLLPKDVVADGVWCDTFKALKYPKEMVGYLSFDGDDWFDAVKMAALFSKYS